MKKILKKSVLLLPLLFIMFIVNVNASTNTLPRSEDNLYISEDINVTEYVKQQVLKTPRVNENEKIYDFADLLTDTQESALYNDIVDFIENHNMDMVVVTINENNKYSAMDYADDFYDYNNFGIGSTHDGLLLLIDMDTREVWISTTGEAILMYNDARIDTILDYVQPKLKSKNYSSAVSNFIHYANNYANNGIPSGNKNSYIDSDGEYVYRNNKDFFEILINNFQIVIIGAVICTAIFISIGVSKHRNVKKANRAILYVDKDSINLTGKKDTFIRSNTTKTKIEHESSSSSRWRFIYTS